MKKVLIGLVVSLLIGSSVYAGGFDADKFMKEQEEWANRENQRRENEEQLRQLEDRQMQREWENQQQLQQLEDRQQEIENKQKEFEDDNHRREKKYDWEIF